MLKMGGKVWKNKEYTHLEFAEGKMENIIFFVVFPILTAIYKFHASDTW